jgi:hypothetical protein
MGLTNFGHHYPSRVLARLLRRCRQHSAFDRPCWHPRGHIGYHHFRLAEHLRYLRLRKQLRERWFR